MNIEKYYLSYVEKSIICDGKYTICDGCKYYFPTEEITQYLIDYFGESNLLKYYFHIYNEEE